MAMHQSGADTRLMMSEANAITRQGPGRDLPPGEPRGGADNTHGDGRRVGDRRVGSMDRRAAAGSLPGPERLSALTATRRAQGPGEATSRFSRLPTTWGSTPTTAR